MAANETAAVAACKAFCTAEDIYRRTDYNKDGVLEYAQKLSGANSLYENTAGAGDIALVDRSFANAEGAPLSTAVPKAGRERLILIDSLRNNRTNTSVAAYSLRARAGAPVSVPLGTS